MIYIVTRKSDGAEIYRYNADSPVEWVGYEFSTHDHVAVSDTATEPAAVETPIWRIYVGAFFDRFVEAKLPILSSTDPIVEALIKDASVRQYIALTERRTELEQMLALLQSRIDGITLDPVAILDTPPAEGEQVSEDGQTVYLSGRVTE